MEFVKRNHEKFIGSPNMAFFIAIMKFLVSLLAELINILIILQSDNNIDVVKDYIALGIIAELDNLMIQTIDKFDPSE